MSAQNIGRQGWCDAAKRIEIAKFSDEDECDKAHTLLQEQKNYSGWAGC